MSKGKSTTTTTTDPTQMAIYEDLYGKAQGIAQQPFIPYTGGRVAGFNPDQLMGFDATRNMFNQSMGFNPRNQLNNLANMSAPGVNLPFGYSQPQRTPIFQPMPITGGGGRPPQPPSIGGIGGGRPVMPGDTGMPDYLNDNRIGNYGLEQQQRQNLGKFTGEPPREGPLVGGIVEPTREIGGIVRPTRGGLTPIKNLGVTVPRPDPIRNPIRPSFQSQTNPFSPTQLQPAAMQQAANIAPVDLYSGASVNRGDVRDVTPRSLLDTDLGAYQNPFQSQVIDNTIGDLNRARQMQIQSDQDAAIGRGAFGGSRSALLESETNRNFAEEAARASGNLRSQGFDRATGLAGQDIGRQFDADRYMSGVDSNVAMQNASFGQQAGLARQGLLGDVAQNQAQLDARRFGADQSALNQFGLQQGQFNNQMNMGMFDAANRAAFMQPELEMRNRQFQAGLLNNQLSDQYRNLGMLSGIGGQQQGLQQRGMDAGYNEFLRAIGYGPQQLGLLAQGVSALPTQSNVTSSQKAGVGDFLGGAAGLLGSAWTGGFNPFGFLG